MQGLINATTQSVLTRFLANIFLFIMLLVALGIGAYQIITNQPVSPIILSLISIGAGSMLSILGINHGSTLTPVSLPGLDTTTITTTSKPAATTAPTMAGH